MTEEEVWWETPRKCPHCDRLMISDGKVYACTHCGHTEDTRKKEKRKEEKDHV
jgi:DNA-directed RNA polymerase subunit M/transcription elongation factor TFIIS